jgi:hypothetical protein
VAELERHETALDTVASRIAGLEDVHLAVSSDPSPRTTSAETPEEFRPETVIDSFLIDETLTIEALAPSEPVVDDADELLSIFDQAESAGVEVFEDPRPSPPRVGVEPPPPPPQPGFGPLSFTPTGTAEPLPPPRPAVPSMTPPLGMPGLDQSPRFVRPAPERGSELVELPAERPERFRVVPDPEPVVPEVTATDVPETGARTLRCGECGAMNRPLEWYCEKCGAELTAV